MYTAASRVSYLEIKIWNCWVSREGKIKTILIRFDIFSMSEVILPCIGIRSVYHFFFLIQRNFFTKAKQEVRKRVLG